MTDQATFQNVANQPNDNQEGERQGTSFTNENQNTASGNQGGQGNENLLEQIKVLEKRLQDKDQFIETLKGERRQDDDTITALKTKLEELESKSRSVEEVLERMNNNSSQGTNGDDGPRLSPEEIKRIAAETYSQKQSEAEQEANLKRIASDLVKVWGDKTDEKVREVASSVGMTFDEAFEMARVRPTAFRKLFLPSNTTNEPSVPNSSINPSALNGQPQNRNTKAFHELNTDKARMAYLRERFKEKGISWGE